MKSSYRWRSGARLWSVITIIGLIGFATDAQAQGFVVESVTPRAYSADARPFDPVRIRFSEDVDASSLDGSSITVYGSESGRCTGAISYDAPNQTVVYDPPCAFKEGELVSVIVKDIRSAGGVVAPAFQWQFTPRVEYGTGVFEGPDEFALGLGRDPVHVFAGDLDGDLFADLAVANSAAGTVSILINQRNRPRRFTQVTEVETGNGPYHVTGGDLNADGQLDLVVSNLLENTLTILINQGNAVFTNTILETGERPLRTEIFDADNDGDQDLAVAAFGIDEVWVHGNNNDGTFAPPISISVGASPAGMVARDWDNDGFIDLYVASLGDQQLEFLKNDGTGTFEPPVSTPIPFSPAALAANDLLGISDNRFGDTLVDLVVSAQNARDIWVFQNTGNGGALQPAFALPVDSTSSQALGLVIADIDSSDAQAEMLGLGQDFDLDVVSTHFTSGEVRPFLNSANTSFLSAAPASYPSALLPQEQNPSGIASADFDGDGDIDLAVVNTTSGKISVFYNEGGRNGPLLVNPDLLTFGEVCVDDDSTRSVTLTNATNFAVAVDVSVRPDEVVYTAGASTVSIEPGETVVVPVSFVPLAARDYEAELVLRSEILSNVCGDNAEPVVIEQTIPLSGRGVSALLSVSPDTLDFGTIVVGDITTATAVVENQGNIPASIGEYILSDAVNFAVNSPALMQEIGALAEQPVEVAFQPVVSGIYLETLDIVTNDRCGNDTLRVVLRATALDPLPDLIPVDLAAATGFDLTTLRTGDPLQLMAGIENQLFAVQDSFLSQFTMITPAGATVTIGDIELPGIDIETISGLLSDVITLDQEGAYQFCFDVDVGMDIEEQTDENNQLCLDPITVRPMLPDLLAADLLRTDGSTAPILRGQQHDYTGIVQNIGEIDLDGPFQVEMRVNGIAAASFVYDGLAVGAEEQFTAPIDFPDTGTFTLSFFVDALEAHDEISEENNEFVLPPLEVELPDELAVEPNPFTPNGDTFNDAVAFRVNEFGLNEPVLRIFSFEGRLIRTNDELIDGALMWDGRDESGREQRPGVYLFTVEDRQQVVASGHLTLAR